MDENKIREIAARAVSAAFGKITLELSKKLAAAIEKKAAQMGISVVVAVADAGARTILAESMDGAYIASYDIAVNKAFTCASLKMTTAQLKELSQPGEALYGIQFTNGGKIVIFGGGNPLKIDGRIVGGLGVSGGSEEQDTMLSAYGAEVFETLM